MLVKSVYLIILSSILLNTYVGHTTEKKLNKQTKIIDTNNSVVVTRRKVVGGVGGRKR